MLRHMEIVKKLISQGNDGVMYDKHFRITKAFMPHIVWGQFIGELVVRKMYQPGNTTAHNYNGTNSSAYKSGYCNFVNSGSCARRSCKYKHSCSLYHKAGSHLKCIQLSRQPPGKGKYNLSFIVILIM